jgi:hypothetical protein
MRVEELRIGNWLNHDSVYRQVSSLHSDNTLRFKFEESSIGCFKATISTIKPIPLTEEILLKCYNDFSTDFRLEYKNNRLHIFFCEKWLLVCDYLHEYQNAHYLLTNQELNIEL